MANFDWSQLLALIPQAVAAKKGGVGGSAFMQGFQEGQARRRQEMAQRQAQEAATARQQQQDARQAMMDQWGMAKDVANQQRLDEEAGLKRNAAANQEMQGALSRIAEFADVPTAERLMAAQAAQTAQTYGQQPGAYDNLISQIGGVITPKRKKQAQDKLEALRKQYDEETLSNPNWNITMPWGGTLKYADLVKLAETDLTDAAGNAAPMKVAKPTQSQTEADRLLGMTPDEQDRYLGAKRRLSDAGRAPEVSVEPDQEAPTDAMSGDILTQTGLSFNAFRALVGQMSQLPRDRVTRNKAAAEAQAWARSHNVDISTLPAQYQSYNTVLGRNIERLNNTKIMEQELDGTVQNLQSVLGNDFSKVRLANVWKIWAGEQVNDPTAQQYAFHLGQLRNELAAYYAAAAGRPGSGILITDLKEAENTIKNGIGQGGIAGIAKGVRDSTAKMGPIMQRSVDTAQRAIWNLFGVGQNYQDKHGTAGPEKHDPLGLR